MDWTSLQECLSLPAGLELLIAHEWSEVDTQFVSSGGTWWLRLLGLLIAWPERKAALDVPQAAEMTPSFVNLT